MARTEQDLLKQARRDYETGRLRGALREGWLVVPVLAFCLLAHFRIEHALIGSTVLWALATFFLWRGQGWARGVWPGWLLGLVPLAIAAMAPSREMCRIGTACLSGCMLGGIGGGLLAGMGIGVLASRQQDERISFLLAASIIAAVTGGCGCAFAGISGLIGMLAGGLIGGIPTYAAMRATGATGAT